MKRIRLLAVGHRYPAEWIAQKLASEGYRRPHGQWSAEQVERIAAEHGIGFYPHKDDSLALWRPGPHVRPPLPRGGSRR